MPLGDDQRAMLQLLLEGGQSYADIGALLGVDAGEVRSRARSALTELAGVDPDDQVGLTDYLLGQADPIGRADAARQLQNDPGSADIAAKLATQLRLIAPKARLPELPAQVGAAPLAAPAPGVPTEPVPRSPGAAGSGGARRAAAGARSGIAKLGGVVGSLGSGDRRLPIALGALALLIVAVVIVVTGVFGGGDNKSSNSSASQAGDNPEIVKLSPVGNSNASGQITIARTGDQPVLQVNLSGLQPSGKSDGYFIWLYNSNQQAYPVSQPSQADSQGNITGQTALSASVERVLPAFNAFVVSRASVNEAKQVIANLKKQKTKNPLLPFFGTPVLQGTIPHPGTSTGTGATGTTGTTPTTTTGR